MSTSNTLAGSIALVTGASSGLGRHFATVLAQAGAVVAIAARRVDRLEELAANITANGGRALPVRMDVTSAESVKLALDNIEAKVGAPTIVVNNSGVAVNKPLLEQTEEDWDAVLDTNLKGAFLVSTEAARRMQRKGQGGSIINVASIVGLRTAGALSPYAASKAGLLHLTRNMALELARFNIRVNALAPGYIDTELNRDFWETPAGAAMIKRIPQRHLGKEQDLDGALLLLAGEGSSFITGAVLAIDGGHAVSGL